MKIERKNSFIFEIEEEEVVRKPQRNHSSNVKFSSTIKFKQISFLKEKNEIKF